METLDVVILAVIQGLTEFLPVSSSGHLVIANALFGASAANDDSVALTVNIVLHAGTLLAVLAVYRKRVQRLFGEDMRVAGKLAVGTLPAVVVGVAIKLYCPHLVTGNPLLAGTMLVVTGCMLLWGARRPPGNIAYQEITYSQALLIGTLQAVAILPGISRSGATIVAGLAVGLRRDSAAAFSFLLAIPVIGGAALWESVELVQASRAGVNLFPLLIGLIVAFLVGLVSLRWLLRWLERGRLQLFAWWCIPMGIAAVLWQLLK